MTDIEGGKSASAINIDTISEDEVVASYVARGTCFIILLCQSFPSSEKVPLTLGNASDAPSEVAAKNSAVLADTIDEKGELRHASDR